MRSERITFNNEHGQLLSATMEFPVTGDPKAYAIFAHCFTCNKNLNAVRNISRALALRGIAVLRFDFTGLGQSEGEFAETNFSSNISDLHAAADYLAEHHEAPQVMIGHSLGGAAAIFAGAERDSIKAIATLGAPADPEHVTHLLSDSDGKLEREGEAEVQIGGRPFTIKKQFIDDLKSKDLPLVLKDMRKALLVAHSPQDVTVGVGNAAKIYANAHHPKSFISLDGADHLLSDSKDSNYVGEVISAWVSRYIDFTETETLSTDALVMARLDEPGFTTKMKIGTHFSLADEPASLGGSNLGPSPYEFVCAGLAACTVMTIRMYTDRKNWPIDTVDVHVDYEKVSGRDSDAKLIDVFSRRIAIEGELSEEQKKRVLQIANKCPVHRSLENVSEIKTELLAQ